jgi:hypothetical protein
MIRRAMLRDTIAVFYVAVKRNAQNARAFEYYVFASLRRLRRKAARSY